MKKNKVLVKVLYLLLAFVLVGNSFMFVSAEANLEDDSPDEPFDLDYLDEPYYSPDGLTVYNAVPPLVVVDNPNSDMQTPAVADAPETAEMLDPDAAGAVFSIAYVASGGTDLWGEPCYTFPTEARAAFEAAAAIWTKTIESSVPITIRACWANLGSSSVLGYSGGQPMHRDFSGAPQSGVWYQGALANSLHGSDLAGGDYDMNITYNSRFSWYYGTDGNTPAGNHDLVTVATHEIAHGLNFSGTAQYSAGTGYWGFGTGYSNIYDTFMESSGGTKVTAYTNPSTSLGSLYTSNNLWWDGSNANAANGGSRVKMYAPSTWANGSSYSHLDYSTFSGTSNRLMVYAISAGTSQHTPGAVTVGILQDVGWKKAWVNQIPTPKAPSGTITDTTPTYEWSRVEGATKYKLELYKDTTKVYTVYPSSSLCGATDCTKTPTTTLSPGNYKWRIRALIGGVWKDNSAYKTFSIPAPISGFTSWFGSNALGWKSLSGTWNITQYGWYQTNGEIGVSSSTAYNTWYPTMTYEAKMMRVTDSTSANRLIIRGWAKPLDATNGWYSAYLFQYTNNGTFSVFKVVDGAVTQLQAWTPYAGINPFTWNTLKVTASGSSLRFYINGGLVWSGTDPSLVDGKVGIGMYRANTGWNPLNVDWAKLSTTVSAAALDEPMAVGIGEPVTDWENPNESPDMNLIQD